jgi:hypothetical protein
LLIFSDLGWNDRVLFCVRVIVRLCVTRSAGGNKGYRSASSTDLSALP